MRGSVKLFLALQGGVALIWGPVLASNAGAANMIHAVGYFSSGTDSVDTFIAQHYDMGFAGIEFGQHPAFIRNLNPNFQWFVYKSGTDNYTRENPRSPDDSLLFLLAQKHGWDYEECYLHYYDDTTTLFPPDMSVSCRIPGWGGGSAVTKKEARVPVYCYGNCNRDRTALNFYSPRARQLLKELFIRETIDSTFAGTRLYPDGIVLDNMSSGLTAAGDAPNTPDQGGHVLEDPNHSDIWGNEFRVWYWNECISKFEKELRDTLLTSATWSKDHRLKKLMANISNQWTDDYYQRGLMDIGVMEFEYDPPRDCGPYAVEQAWQHDQMAAAGGMTSWYHPVRQTQCPGLPGTISEDDAYMGPLAWYLTTRTANSIIDIQGVRNPGDAGFVRHAWLPVLDVVRTSLGNYTGDPYLFATGIDPLGRKYHVWARNYENGLVMVRNVGDYGEGLEDAGAVTLNLPLGNLRRIHGDGTIDEPSSTISIKNGIGAIFLGTYAHPVPAADVPGLWWGGTPNFGTVPLTVHFQDHSTRNPTSWEWVLNDKTWETSTEQNPTYTYTEPGLYTVRMRATNSAGTADWLTMGLYIDAISGTSAPTAAFVARPISGRPPLTVSFTDQSANSPTSWSWAFGDGGTSNLQSPTHVYSLAGNYSVTLTASNADGSGTLTKTNYISVVVGPTPRAPETHFNANHTSGVVPLAVTFADSSLYNPTAWSWNFGDGGTSTEQNPDHVYRAPGTYTVTLTATNDAGSDTETKTGYVHVTEGGNLDIGKYEMFANRPNPFRTITRITFNLPSAGPVRLEAFGPDGRSVAVLIDGDREAGNQSISWQPRNFSAGIYMLRLSWQGKVLTRTVMYVK